MPKVYVYDRRLVQRVEDALTACGVTEAEMDEMRDVESKKHADDVLVMPENVFISASVLETAAATAALAKAKAVSPIAPIINAARNGDVDAVRQQIANGIHIYRLRTRLKPVLELVTNAGHTQLVRDIKATQEFLHVTDLGDVSVHFSDSGHMPRRLFYLLFRQYGVDEATCRTISCIRDKLQECISKETNGGHILFSDEDIKDRLRAVISFELGF